MASCTALSVASRCASRFQGTSARSKFSADAYAHPALSFLFLGVLAEIASALYLSALIFGGARLAATFRRRRGLAAGGTSAVATVFLGFAVKLSLAHG